MYDMSIHLAFCLTKSTKFKVFRRNFRTKTIEKTRSYAVCRLLSYYNTSIYTSYNSCCFHIINCSFYIDLQFYCVQTRNFYEKKKLAIIKIIKFYLRKIYLDNHILIWYNKCKQMKNGYSPFLLYIY